MRKRWLHIILSGWLSLLLLFGGTAKEFIHLFTSHTDTVHVYHAKGDLSFENQHRHCKFLGFSLAPFVERDVLKPLHFELSVYIVAPQVFYTHTIHRTALISSLRGPPSFFTC